MSQASVDSIQLELKDPGLQPAWIDLNSALQQMKFLAVKTTVRPLCCLSVASEEGRLIFIKDVTSSN